MPLTDAARALRLVHDRVDAEARRIAARHGDRLRCGRGCASCCVDGLTVFEVEAERIRARHAELLADGRPHPPGACAFLDAEGACRIYEQRPYVCRTQGLPLRWVETRETGPVELRDICPLNEPGGPPVETLPADICWTLGPVEGELAALERSRREPPARVALRSLFRAAG